MAARYAQKEMWHPDQVLTSNNDIVELEIPFSKSHELLREILACGDEAEVISPESLRNEVSAKIEGMRKNYHKVR